MLFSELQSILAILLLQKQVSLDPVNTPSYAGNSTPLQTGKASFFTLVPLTTLEKLLGTLTYQNFYLWKVCRSGKLAWPIKTFKLGHLPPMSTEKPLSSTKL